jgi:thioredoxin-related protein
MNKNLLTFGLLGMLALVGFLIFTSSNSERKIVLEEVKEEVNLKPAEKVQVFVFHSNNRCYSCETMGKLTKATIEKYFQNEIKEGKVEFREINVDLPENKEIAQKFEATGSSIFINAIVDGEDNIKEETQPWRLLSNRQAFSDYLTKKVKEKLK